ncbi:MAG: hypothetical protein JXR48_06950, partial [Candidatus Delongbacteria bacterium]|nr:hypothetical protein [Candidatus Delongbacteria bacterium]
MDLSTPGDAFEQQADRIADQMVQMKPNSEALMPKIDSVQAKGGSDGGEVPHSTEKGIKQLSGKGSSLSKPVREFFE